MAWAAPAADECVLGMLAGGAHDLLGRPKCSAERTACTWEPKGLFALPASRVKLAFVDLVLNWGEKIEV